MSIQSGVVPPAAPGNLGRTPKVPVSLARRRAMRPALQRGNESPRAMASRAPGCVTHCGVPKGASTMTHTHHYVLEPFVPSAIASDRAVRMLRDISVPGTAIQVIARPAADPKPGDHGTSKERQPGLSVDSAVLAATGHAGARR